MLKPLMPYLYGACVVLVLALVAGIYLKGRSDATAKAREASLQAELAVARKDLAIAADAATKAQIQQAILTATKLELERSQDDFEKELAARPDPVCVLSPADAERLRSQALGRPYVPVPPKRP